MLKSEQHFNHSQRTIAPLVLPHEFYCRDRTTSVRSYKFRKDLSDQVTISFAQKRVKKQRSANQETKYERHQSKEGNIKSHKISSLNRLDLNCHSSCRTKNNNLIYGVNKKYEIPCDSGQNSIAKDDVCDRSQDEDTHRKIEILDICNLANDIKSILHSDMFMNELLEDDMLQEANKDLNDKRWHEYFTKFVVPSILELGQEIQIIYDTYERIQQRCKDNLIAQAFGAWKSITIRSINKDIVEKVEHMHISYYNSKKRSVFHVLSCLSLGTSSRKKILQRRRNGLARARESLSKRLKKKNEIEGVVTNHMVQKELRKIFYTELFDWNRKRYLENCFHKWKVMFHEAKEANVIAINHLRSKLFKKWRCWSNEQVFLIEGDCSNRFQKFLHAEAFCDKILCQKSFRAWRIKAVAYSNAARIERRIITKIVRNIMKAWLQMTKERRAMKSHVLKEWRNFHHYTVGRPFLCWRNIAVSLIETRRNQLNFFKCYKLVKRRKKQWRIFRTWRHQARYGRVTSMYTRHDLLELLYKQNDRIEDLRSQVKDKSDSNT